MPPQHGSREHLLGVAARLFAAHGVRAVGTHRIVEAAGSGKNALYQHFPTKDDLVAAYLELVSHLRSASTARAVAAAGDDPGDQLVAVVAEVAERVAEPAFRGCVFRNHLVEFPGTDDLATAVARAYLAGSRGVLDRLAVRMDVAAPDELCDQLWMLLDALYLQAAYRGPPVETVDTAGSPYR